jgi:GWxTD domain-containing protein
MYQKWLIEDVRWIISDQERADFKKLSTDAQREEFVVAFWERRNPTPGAPENVFKEEHYRRLAYANESFPEGVAGYNTDRGHIYIKFGPPDQIDHHPDTALDPNQAKPTNVEGQPASEVWYYRYIEGMGADVIIQFVDDCQCGKYHMVARRPKK